MKLKSQLNYERDFANWMCSLGHHCERIAGSGRREDSVCDCILFKEGKTYLVELKATKEKVLRINSKIRKQLERLVDVSKKHNLTPLLVIRFKKRGWIFVELNCEIEKSIKFDRRLTK